MGVFKPVPAGFKRGYADKSADYKKRLKFIGGEA